MPAAYNSLVDGLVTSPDPGPVPTDNNAGATMGASMGPNLSAAASASVGTPPLTGRHNTPLQVAFLGIIALGIIVLLRKLGFSFSVAGKVGR